MWVFFFPLSALEWAARILCAGWVCAIPSPWNSSLIVQMERGTESVAEETWGCSFVECRGHHCASKDERSANCSSLWLEGSVFQGSDHCAHDAEGRNSLFCPVLLVALSRKAICRHWLNFSPHSYWISLTVKTPENETSWRLSCTGSTGSSSVCEHMWGGRSIIYFTGEMFLTGLVSEWDNPVREIWGCDSLWSRLRFAKWLSYVTLLW